MATFSAAISCEHGVHCLEIDADAGPAQNAALEINKDVASKAWPSVLDPIVDSLTADNELRTLSAAARLASLIVQHAHTRKC